MIDIQVTVTPREVEPPPVQWPDNLWRIVHDIERGDLWRAKVPEVYLFNPVHLVPLTKGWQEMWFDLFSWGAPNLGTGDYLLKHWESLLGCHRAFTNNKGFGCRRPPPRGPHGPFANYIRREDLNASLPALDKCRVTGGATVAGEQVGDVVVVEALSEPVSLAWLIEHPWFFYPATTVNEFGMPSHFPQGDGSPSYVPLVATKKITYPVAFMEKVDSIADPLYVKATAFQKLMYFAKTVFKPQQFAEGVW